MNRGLDSKEGRASKTFFVFCALPSYDSSFKRQKVPLFCDWGLVACGPSLSRLCSPLQIAARYEYCCILGACMRAWTWDMQHHPLVHNRGVKQILVEA